MVYEGAQSSGLGRRDPCRTYSSVANSLAKRMMCRVSGLDACAYDVDDYRQELLLAAWHLCNVWAGLPSRTGSERAFVCTGLRHACSSMARRRRSRAAWGEYAAPLSEVDHLADLGFERALCFRSVVAALAGFCTDRQWQAVCRRWFGEYQRNDLRIIAEVRAQWRLHGLSFWEA